MDINEVARMIESAGLVLIEKKRLVEIQANVKNALDEYTPYKWQGKDVPISEVYSNLRSLGLSIDTTAVQAGIVQCIMPECTRKAEIVSSMRNAYFCRTCFKS